MKKIFSLMLFFSLSVSAEYYRVTPENCPNNMFREFSLGAYFANNAAVSRVREIELFKFAREGILLRMTINFDGPEREKNLQELAQRLSYAGIKSKASRFNLTPGIISLHLKGINLDGLDAYRKALSVIQSFEVIEPGYMGDNIQATIEKMLLDADRANRSDYYVPRGDFSESVLGMDEMVGDNKQKPKNFSRALSYSRSLPLLTYVAPLLLTYPQDAEKSLETSQVSGFSR